MGKTIIDEHATTCKYLLIAQQTQFHTENVEQIAPLVAEVPGLGTVFNNYEKDATALETEYNQRAKAEETDLMAGKDWHRDGTGGAYLSLVDFYDKFPRNEVESTAIHPIKFLADTYRQTVKKDYKSETRGIRGLIRDTRKLTAQLALFPALTPLLDRLETENNEYEELDIVRTHSLEAKRKRGTLGALGKKANESFDDLVKVVTGLYIAKELNTSAQAALQQIIDILNGQIHRYTVIYHHHAGVIAAKKKDNGGDGGETEEPEEPGEGGDPGEGGEGGDEGDGGDPGEGGTENPDIENPPLPPFLPDFE
ncbi:hypothetical protein FACS1894181_08020 [Bacteroidia bacterium]|nr:hypothetical protein FACS1894181_08020 [Bacteroidia bacterium]